jgi:hypothetical protein
MKDKANRVSPAVHGEFGVFEIRNTADFYKEILFHFSLE